MKKLPALLLAAAAVMTVFGTPMTSHAAAIRVANCNSSANPYMTGCSSQTGSLSGMMNQLGVRMGSGCGSSQGCQTGSTCAKTAVRQGQSFYYGQNSNSGNGCQNNSSSGSGNCQTGASCGSSNCQTGTDCGIQGCEYGSECGNQNCQGSAGCSSQGNTMTDSDVLRPNLPSSN